MAQSAHAVSAALGEPFAVVFALPAIGWWRLNLNPIIAFWAAYVVTRPLGASFADGFSKPSSGGLRLGDGTVSAVALVVFVALVAYVAVTKRDVQNRRAERGGRGPSHLHMPHTHLEGAPRPQAAES